MKHSKDTFNDRMVRKTVLPVIYLWLLACGAVVGMGIWKPEVVLMNLDGFIALIAIIGGTAAPALQTLLRMWETEQTIEVDSMPTELEHERDLCKTKQAHELEIQKLAQAHEQAMATSAQSHSHEMDKLKTPLSVDNLVPKQKK
jgi:hypothetical protein